MMQQTGVIETAIAGVTHNNDNGTSRQVIIRLCKVNDPLNLKHEAVEQDANAVKVLRGKGDQVGFLSRELAAEIAPLLDQGEIIHAEVVKKTRFAGTDGKMKWGCVIRLTSSKYLKAQQAKKGKGCLIGACIIGGLFLLVLIIIIASC